MKKDTTGIEARRNAAGVVSKYRVTSAKGERRYFPATATTEEMQEWRADGVKPKGSTSADVERFLADATLTPTNKKRYTQQLDFWCKQSIDDGADVLTVAQVLDGGVAPGRLIGDVPRALLQPARLRVILSRAFAPSDPDNDPYEFGATSNHYRTALARLFSWSDRDNEKAANPLDNVDTRPTRKGQFLGQDPRVVRMILECMPTKYGRDGAVSVKRATVLAHVPITPIQLQRLDPAKNFRDIPDADRDAQIRGEIALMVRPRLKGQRKTLPAPELEPLTPYGVAAVRALVAEPAAWEKQGKFSTSSLNKAFKAACRRAEPKLAALGVEADLSTMTVYQLKHSLTAAMQLSSGGLTDRDGKIRIDPGVRKTLGHSTDAMTKVYALAAIDPLKKIVSERLSRYLDAILDEPLAPPAAKAAPKLRRVK